MALGTYSELVASVQDWLDRNDLSGAAADMIALAEARIKREVEPMFSETVAQISVVDGLGDLPANFGTADIVIYDNRALPNYSSVVGFDVPDAAQPYAYSFGIDKLRIWPAGDWTISLVYHPRFTALSESNETNEFLTTHPDIYFYGALMYAEGYVANDPRAANFKALWDEALAELKVYLTRQKFAGPLVPRIDFVP